MGVYLWKERLPSAYQEVEYIESTGVQYIDSLYKPNYDTEISCKFAHNEHIINTPVFGARTASGGNVFNLFSHPSEYTAADGETNFNRPTWSSDVGHAANISNYPEGTIIEFSYDRTGWSYGSQSGTWSPSSGGPNVDMIIFGMRQGTTIDSRKFSGKLWYFKISENGTLVRDFVPCYRKSDNEVGLYDLVNSVFYTNAGTGAFTKGPDVNYVEHELKNAYIGEYNPFDEYQEVEYIQSTATSPGNTSSSGQYIDSLVTINKDIKIEIDLQFTSTATQSRLFGCGYDSGSSGITFDAYINGSTQWARGTANGTGNWQTTNISANTNRNKFVLDNSRYIIYNASGTQVYNATNIATITNSDTWTIPLLARLNKAENKICQHSSAKLYACKIWDNNVLVRDFTPCYRKSDNEIGLWDKVNNEFYPNAGSGTFTKGPDVN